MAINFAVQETPGRMNRLLAILLGSVVTNSLLLSASTLGPVSAFLNMFMAMPLAYVGMRYGVGSALVGVTLTAAIQYAVAGFYSGGLYLLQFSMATIGLPWLLKVGISWLRSVLICTLCTAVLAGGFAGGYAARQEMTVTEMVNQYIDKEVASARTIYDQAELPKDQLDNLYLVLDSTADFFRQAFWGLATTAFMLLSLMTVGMLKVAPQRTYAVPGCMFHHLKLSEYLVWVLIAAGFSLLIKQPVVQQLALNCLTVILPLYFLQGIAIITFFFRKKAFSTLSRVFGYLLILVVNPLPLLVTAIGVFDMWFDFRKPRVKTT